jgi:amidophosphoribosyltransferase
MIEWIRKDLGVTTLRYQTIEEMIESIGLPKEKLCTYCWTGECPGRDKSVASKVKKEKFKLKEKAAEK